jgi:hypothetical protein
VSKELGSEAKTVQELLKIPGGSEWWKQHGSATEMTFDLSKDSESMKIWKKYISRKG